MYSENAALLLLMAIFAFLIYLSFEDSEAGQNQPMHEQSDYFYVENVDIAEL
jgi:hypothetical protein